MKCNNLRINGKKVLTVVLVGYLICFPDYSVAEKIEPVERTVSVSYKNVPKEKYRENKETALVPEEFSLEKVMVKRKKRKGQFFE